MSEPNASWRLLMVVLFDVYIETIFFFFFFGAVLNENLKSQCFQERYNNLNFHLLGCECFVCRSPPASASPTAFYPPRIISAKETAV